MSVIEIGRLNGRYVVFWREDPDDPKTRRRFRLKAKNRADAWAEGRRVYDSQLKLKGDQLSFEDAWKNYRKQLGDRTTGKMLDHVWQKVGPFFGKYHPLQIDDELVSKYIEHRTALFRKENGGRDPSSTTIHNDVNLVQCALNHAFHKNLISKPVKLRKLPRSKPRERWLTDDEIQSLLEQCKITPHLYVAVVLLLSTAARMTAVLELTWDRVDFDKRTIDLRTGEDPHSKRRAFVPMNDGLYTLLMQWREHCDSNWVVEYHGGPIKSIYPSFRRAARRSGLEDVHPHVLRHSSAVHMVAGGCKMERVSQYLGHSSVAVTERVYARFAPEHLRQEASTVDFLNKGKKN